MSSPMCFRGEIGEETFHWYSNAHHHWSVSVLHRWTHNKYASLSLCVYVNDSCLLQPRGRAETAESRFPWCQQWDLCSWSGSSLPCSEVSIRQTNCSEGFNYSWNSPHSSLSLCPLYTETTEKWHLYFMHNWLFCLSERISEGASVTVTSSSSWTESRWWAPVTWRRRSTETRPCCWRCAVATTTCSSTSSLMSSCSDVTICECTQSRTTLV